MATKRSPKKMPAVAEPKAKPVRVDLDPAIAESKTKPVRVDLDPAIHHALRKAAAEQNVSMAALARKLISEAMSGRKGGPK